MSILTTAERIGMQKGIAQGIEQGLRQTITDILEIKFGVAGLELLEPVEQMSSIEILEKIRTGLKQAQSVAEAEALIRAHVNGQAQAA